MTLEEMKLAVCERLPEVILIKPIDSSHYTWRAFFREPYRQINWPTEGLAVCHEAGRLLDDDQRMSFMLELASIVSGYVVSTLSWAVVDKLLDATWEQLLEALCRVWFPERFN